jgi:hypothetical protein
MDKVARYVSLSAFYICNILFIFSLFIYVPFTAIVFPLLAVQALNTITLIYLTIITFINKVINKV